MIFSLSLSTRFTQHAKLFTIFQQQSVWVELMEQSDAKLYVKIPPIDKPTQGRLASLLMQVEGVKWVEKLSDMPSQVEHNLFRTAFESNPNACILINKNAEPVQANAEACRIFSINNTSLPKLKEIFSQPDWSDKLDLAVRERQSVVVETTAGIMLLSVSQLAGSSTPQAGALLVFQRADSCVLDAEKIKANTLTDDGLYQQSQTHADLQARALALSAVEAPLLMICERGEDCLDLMKYCHINSQRKHGVCRHINCAQLSAIDQYVSLFGDKTHEGLVKQCVGGTLLLENIGALAVEVQHHLYTWLSENTQIPRMIVSYDMSSYTEENEATLIAELLNILDVLRLEIPALSNQISDIETLAFYYLGQFREWLKKPDLKFSAPALTLIKSYRWPGNVYQLKDVVFKAVMQADLDLIKTEHIELNHAITFDVDLYGDSLPKAVAEFEKQFLEHWYEKYPSTRKLANQMGVSHTTIAQKLNRYGLTK